MPDRRYIAELRGRRRRRADGNCRTGMAATIRTPSGTVKATVYPDELGRDHLRAILYTDAPGVRVIFHGPISGEDND